MNSPYRDAQMALNPLTLRLLELPCPNCHKKSLKSVVEVVMDNKLPCDFCGNSIDVTLHYSLSKIQKILIRLGHSGNFWSNGKQQ